MFEDIELSKIWLFNRIYQRMNETFFGSLSFLWYLLSPSGYSVLLFWNFVSCFFCLKVIFSHRNNLSLKFKVKNHSYVFTFRFVYAALRSIDIMVAGSNYVNPVSTKFWSAIPWISMFLWWKKIVSNFLTKKIKSVTICIWTKYLEEVMKNIFKERV